MKLQYSKRRPSLMCVSRCGRWEAGPVESSSPPGGNLNYKGNEGVGAEQTGVRDHQGWFLTAGHATPIDA